MIGVYSVEGIGFAGKLLFGLPASQPPFYQFIDLTDSLGGSMTVGPKKTLFLKED